MPPPIAWSNAQTVRSAPRNPTLWVFATSDVAWFKQHHVNRLIVVNAAVHIFVIFYRNQHVQRVSDVETLLDMFIHIHQVQCATQIHAPIFVQPCQCFWTPQLKVQFFFFGCGVAKFSFTKICAAPLALGHTGHALRAYVFHVRRSQDGFAQDW